MGLRAWVQAGTAVFPALIEFLPGSESGARRDEAGYDLWLRSRDSGMGLMDEGSPTLKEPRVQCSLGRHHWVECVSLRAVCAPLRHYHLCFAFAVWILDVWGLGYGIRVS